MTSEQLTGSILAARDGRQQALSRALSTGYPAIVSVSLNIPGAEKMPPGSQELFLWAMAEMRTLFPEAKALENSTDALGSYAILGIDVTPAEVKTACIALESGSPAARLIDLDVYAPDGQQVGRRSLGVPARPCLICDLDAVECMRTRRHPLAEVVAKAITLLNAQETRQAMPGLPPTFL